MHQFRDFSAIPGVAQPKTAAHMDTHARMSDSGDSIAASTAGFANPSENILAIGVQSGMKVADFGAGSGAYTLGMARTVGRTGKVYAVEVQKSLLTRIKNQADQEQLQNVEIIWGDFEKPEGSRIAAGSLDRVVMSNVLFQLENKLGAIHEAKRILKPDGKLAIIDWSDSFGGMGPEQKSVVNRDAALKLAAAGAFTLSSDFKAGAHHYGILLSPMTS